MNNNKRDRLIYISGTPPRPSEITVPFVEDDSMSSGTNTTRGASLSLPSSPVNLNSSFVRADPAAEDAIGMKSREGECGDDRSFEGKVQIEIEDDLLFRIPDSSDWDDQDVEPLNAKDLLFRMDNGDVDGDSVSEYESPGSVSVLSTMLEKKGITNDSSLMRSNLRFVNLKRWEFLSPIGYSYGRTSFAKLKNLKSSELYDVGDEIEFVVDSENEKFGKLARILMGEFPVIEIHVMKKYEELAGEISESHYKFADNELIEIIGLQKPFLINLHELDFSIKRKFSVCYVNNRDLLRTFDFICRFEYNPSIKQIVEKFNMDQLSRHSTVSTISHLPISFSTPSNEISNENEELEQLDPFPVEAETLAQCDMEIEHMDTIEIGNTTSESAEFKSTPELEQFDPCPVEVKTSALCDMEIEHMDTIQIGNTISESGEFKSTAISFDSLETIIANPRPKRNRAVVDDRQSKKKRVEVIPIEEWNIEETETTEQTGNLFSGLGFLFTGIAKDSSSWSKLQKCTALSHQNGALIFKELSDQFWEFVGVKIGSTSLHPITKRSTRYQKLSAIAPAKESSFIVFSDSPCRTQKFLAALARKTPVLSLDWIISCVESNSLVSPFEYILSPNALLLYEDSNTLPQLRWETFPKPASKNERVFSTSKIYLLGSRPYIKEWSPLLSDAGADIRERISISSIESTLHRKNSVISVFILCESGHLIAEIIKIRLIEMNLPILTHRYIADCLIAQRILDPELSSEYTHKLT